MLKGGGHGSGAFTQFLQVLPLHYIRWMLWRVTKRIRLSCVNICIFSQAMFESGESNIGFPSFSVSWHSLNSAGVIHPLEVWWNLRGQPQPAAGTWKEGLSDSDDQDSFGGADHKPQRCRLPALGWDSPSLHPASSCWASL